ncbi:hypothetical protein [Pectobacterium parmentieri]|uniref:Uncharacterized protein n=1 Tax=Pectobacterium parmentieri TaxID=1905730 RepID=A0A8B3FT78_PECPM|nr:hypothetical protein [Pectobacterium parmentieri]AOR58931.1 hypothetical protein A8F97_08420 [Pectobacterium parmentieri]AYH10036.1 hypothetical protein C5E24_10265 [Pectobacterium parmentieri]AYH19253.1 hypothetical protein C5E22_12525 [Pectobacterium parmentieri]AYH36356.1 hypothetical protein C5E17_10215 [Pectobacterium parmentieri]AZS56461.1 hypothetical protein C5E18_10210 [Pectobacterium parmentieri]
MVYHWAMKVLKVGELVGNAWPLRECGTPGDAGKLRLKPEVTLKKPSSSCYDGADFREPPKKSQDPAPCVHCPTRLRAL